MSDIFYINDVDEALIKKEYKRLEQVLQNNFSSEVEFFEVGSTALPDVIGKGDIDVLVRTNLEYFKEVRQKLDLLFVRNHNQLSNDIYQGYIVPSDLDVAIQLTVKNSIYDNFEVFLDALKANKTLRHEYNELKRMFHGKSMYDYRVAKAKFIEGVLSTDI